MQIQLNFSTLNAFGEGGYSHFRMPYQNIRKNGIYSFKKEKAKMLKQNTSTILICTSTKALLLGILVMLGCKSADQNKVQQKLLVGKWSGEWSDNAPHKISMTFSSQDVLIDYHNGNTPQNEKYTLKGDTLTIEKSSENYEITELTKDCLQLSSFRKGNLVDIDVIFLVKFHKER